MYLMCHNFQSGVFFLLFVFSLVIKYLSILYLTPRLIILSKSTLYKYYSKIRIAHNTFSQEGANINFEQVFWGWNASTSRSKNNVKITFTSFILPPIGSIK